MKKIIVENVALFGDSSRAVTVEDIDLVAANPTNEYHILRHYSHVSDEYVKGLIGQEYEYYDPATQGFVSSVITEKDIDLAYQTRGSKFYSGVRGIENPRELITLIKKELRVRIARGDMFWMCKPAYDFLTFSIEYPEYVGDKDFVAVDSLSREQQARIRMVPRSTREGIMFRVVSGVEKFPTHRFVVEIHHFPGKQFAYITGYPGEVGPPFPDPSQSQEEYEYNKHYTDTHVFIE